MTVLVSTSVDVKQNETTVTINDGVDFSKVTRSCVLFIDNQRPVIVDAGTAAAGGASTLTLRTPWPTFDVVAGKAMLLIGRDALVDAIQKANETGQILVNYTKVNADLFSVDNPAYPIPVGTTETVLVPTYKHLENKVNAKIQELEQWRADHHGGTVTVFVDAENGNDLNDGSSISPIKTWSEAGRRIQPTKTNKIYLMTEVTADSLWPTSVFPGRLEIAGHDGSTAAQRKLIVDHSAGAMSFDAGATVFIDRLDLELNNDFCSVYGSFSCSLTNSTVVSNGGHVFSPLHGATGYFRFVNVICPGDKYIWGVSAGSNPTRDGILCNLAIMPAV